MLKKLVGDAQATVCGPFFASRLTHGGGGALGCCSFGDRYLPARDRDRAWAALPRDGAGIL